MLPEPEMMLLCEPDLKQGFAFITVHALRRFGNSNGPCDRVVKSLTSSLTALEVITTLHTDNLSSHQALGVNVKDSRSISLQPNYRGNSRR